MRPVLFETMDATWPAASTRQVGPWLIREGKGGGKRVSAATLMAGGIAPTDQAEQAMRGLGQPALFQIVPGQEALDEELAGRGFALVDPVVLYEASVAHLAEAPPERMSAFTVWNPLQIIVDLWASMGVGPERLAVMDRVEGPRAAMLGRIDDRACAAAFVAVHDNVAMIHALEVLPLARRRGVARNMMREAARWASEAGADRFALAVTRENAPARALYESLGMAPAGEYHYRLDANR